MNNEIKEIFELYEKQANDSDIKIIIKTLKEWYFEKEDYKSRIDKVIEYITKEPKKELSVDSYYKFNDLIEFNDILNILKGDNNE